MMDQPALPAALVGLVVACVTVMGPVEWAEHQSSCRACGEVPF